MVVRAARLEWEVPLWAALHLVDPVEAHPGLGDLGRAVARQAGRLPLAPQ